MMTSTLLCQTIVSTKLAMFIIPIQNAYIQIPVFQGRKFRRETSGSTDRTNPMKLPIGVSGYGVNGYIVESAKDKTGLQW